MKVTVSVITATPWTTNKPSVYLASITYSMPGSAGHFSFLHWKYRGCLAVNNAYPPDGRIDT